MALTLEATYENGTLKLAKPLPLSEHTKVLVTVHIWAEPDIVQESYGRIGWTGDAETVRRVALDPEFGHREGA
jgi:predicted DNA-binding antitoxin AbrB/MazE fold protein